MSDLKAPSYPPGTVRPGETAAYRVAVVYWGLIALTFVGYHLYGAGYAVWLLMTWLLAVRT